MATPTNRVFSTTELLEAVLEGVPPDSLLHAQRVCKRWRTVIQETKSLQRRLFLRADAQDRAIYKHNREKPSLSGWIKEHDSSVAVEKLTRIPWFGVFFGDEKVIPSTHLIIKGYEVNMAALKSTAPCTNMYLTSPPIAWFDLQVYLHQNGTRFWVREVAVGMTDGIGIRVTDVAKVLEKVAERYNADRLDVELLYPFKTSVGMSCSD